MANTVTWGTSYTYKGNIKNESRFSLYTMAELPIPTLEPLPELPNLEMLNSIGFPQPSTFSPVLKGMLDNEVPEGSNKIAVMKDTLSVFNPDQNMIVTAGYLMNILEEVQRYGWLFLLWP